MPVGIDFVKGHGTQNDFVVLIDPDGLHDLSVAQVRALCDRRRGLGADGVLRAVRDTSGEWFMDYRNADGSLAEMCGNGARVFALALRETGLETAAAFPVHTRGGVRLVRFGTGGAVPGDMAGSDVTVSMGVATTDEREVSVSVADRPAASAGQQQAWPASPVWIPNPHAVVVVDDLSDAGRLTVAPNVTPESVFADGVNVEFVVDRGVDPVVDDGTPRIGMRVHERGVGETRSCGTGAVAAAWAWRRRLGLQGSPGTVRVDVPGGTLYVNERADAELELRGPAVIVARGTLDEQWWKENQ